MTDRPRRLGLGVLAVAMLLPLAWTSGAAAATPHVCLDEPVTILGTMGDDVLRGTAGRDVFAGLAGDDEVHGAAGDDVVCGGPGADTLLGGSGADVLSGGPGADAISGGPDPDDLIGRAGADVLEGGPERDGLFGGLGPDQLLGGLAHDVPLIGGPGPDDLQGGSGADLVSYLSSSSPVRVDLRIHRALGDGADAITSVDRVRGSRFDDVISGRWGGQVLIGMEGDDTLRGRRGEDVLEGGPGNDRLVGGLAADSARFQGVGVQASLSAGAARGEGTDRLASVDRLIGSDGPDFLVGDHRGNVLLGDEGNDRLFGMAGDDRLSVGPGGGSTDGGPGDDRCRPGSFGGCERITGGTGKPAWVVAPPDGATLSRGAPTNLVGRVASAVIDAVRVAIRRPTAVGCTWWSGAGLVLRPCSHRLWLGTGLDGTGRWTVRFREALPVGRYEVLVSVDGAGSAVDRSGFRVR